MKNKKALGWIVWILIILILIVIGMVIYFWLFNGSSSAGTGLLGNSIPSPPPLPN